MQDITDVNAYVHLLKTNSSLALCDLTIKNFVVQDFSIDNKQLKVYVCLLVYNLYMLSRVEHTNLYQDVANFLLENHIGSTGVVAMKWIHVLWIVFHLLARWNSPLLQVY